MAKNPRIHALRTAAKAFLIIAAGGHLLLEEGKTFADLCCLAMPMKYRFTRQELDDISNSVKGVLQTVPPESRFNEIDQKLEKILGPAKYIV